MNKIGAAALAFALAVPAAAKELRVASDGSRDFKTLREALKIAQVGDIISIKSEAGKVGASIQQEKGRFVVDRLIPGSAAEAAGVKAGDRLLTVAGAELVGLTLPELIARMAGPVGSTLKIQVQASGGGARDLSIIRSEPRCVVDKLETKYIVAAALGDFETALHFALEAAESGNVPAMVVVAKMFANGQGVAKDIKKGLPWITRAAELGDPEAQTWLSALYAKGEAGLKLDMSASCDWSRRAADKKWAPAIFNLGVCNEFGSIGPKDEQTAANYYRRALDGGYEPAQARLDVLAGKGVHPVVSSPVAAASAPSASQAPAARRSELDDLPAVGKANPNAVAVVVGVEKYREGLPTADFAASDAKLAGEYFRRVLGIADENIIILTDERATKSDFEKYFEQWLPNHADKDAEVFVYYSGHGAPDPAKGDAYLVPYDADPTYIKQTGYSVRRLYAQLGKLPAKRVVVVMDSCFSGAGGRSVLAKGARPLVSVQQDAPPARLTVLSASAADQISNSDQQNGHGLFTVYFLKGLKEKGTDLKAVYDYLKPEVSRVARRQYNAEQVPQWRQGR